MRGTAGADDGAGDRISGAIGAGSAAVTGSVVAPVACGAKTAGCSASAAGIATGPGAGCVAVGAPGTSGCVVAG